MDRKKLLIWINCYGAWAPELRSPIETIGYDQYLSACAQAISLFKNNIEAIYLSGGMFDSLGRTECETVMPELQRRLINLGVDISIGIDEESVTSVSIMKKFLNTWEEKYVNCIPIIFTDSARYDTNEFTFNSYCKELGITSLNVKDVLIAIPRMDNHPDSTPEKQKEKLEYMIKEGIDEVERLGLEARKEHIQKRNQKLSS